MSFNPQSRSQIAAVTQESEAFKQRVEALRTYANVLSHESLYRTYSQYLLDLSNKLPQLIRSNHNRGTTWKSIVESNPGLKKLKLVHTVKIENVESFLLQYVDILLQFLGEFTGVPLGQQTTGSNAQSFAQNLASISSKYMNIPYNELINFESLQVANVQLQHQQGVIQDFRGIVQQLLLKGTSVLGTNKLTGIQNYLQTLQQDIFKARQYVASPKPQNQLETPNDYSTQLLREISSAPNDDLRRARSFLLEWIKNPQPNDLQGRIDQLTGFLNKVLVVLQQASQISWTQIEQEAKQNPYIAQQLGMMTPQNAAVLGAQYHQQQQQKLQRGRQIHIETDLYRLITDTRALSVGNSEFIPFDEFLKIVPQAIPNTQLFQQQREESKKTLTNLFGNSGLGFAKPVVGFNPTTFSNGQKETAHDKILALTNGQFMILKVRIIPGNYSLPQSIQFLFKINQKASRKGNEFLTYHIFSLKRIAPLDNIRLGDLYFPATDNSKNSYAFWAVFVDFQTEFMPVPKYQTQGILLLTYPTVTEQEFFNELQANFQVMVDNNIRPQNSVFKQHATVDELSVIRSSEQYQTAVRLEATVSSSGSNVQQAPTSYGGPSQTFYQQQQQVPSMQPFLSSFQRAQQFQQPFQQPFQQQQSFQPSPALPQPPLFSSNPSNFQPQQQFPSSTTTQGFQPVETNSFTKAIRRSHLSGDFPSLSSLRAMTKKGSDDDDNVNEKEKKKKHRHHRRH
jgi:hypothetical protein